MNKNIFFVLIVFIASNIIKTNELPLLDNLQATASEFLGAQITMLVAQEIYFQKLGRDELRKKIINEKLEKIPKKEQFSLMSEFNNPESKLSKKIDNNVKEMLKKPFCNSIENELRKHNCTLESTKTFWKVIKIGSDQATVINGKIIPENAHITIRIDLSTAIAIMKEYEKEKNNLKAK